MPFEVVEAERQRIAGSHAVRNIGGIVVNTGGGAIPEAMPRWDNVQTSNPRAIANSLELSRARPASRKFAALLDQLDARAHRFDARCMDRLVRGLPWLLPAPSVEEPAETRSGSLSLD
jgi:hypothetical protein